MSAKPEISCAIIDGISSIREDEELQDFVVEVEDKEFKCHRLILSACSGFFRGLFRSGMRESQQQRTKLEGVSMVTFAAILDTLYTGCDYLTHDNMLNVWLAGDQLQIKFVVDRCVNFILENICLENVFSIFEKASLLLHQNITEMCELFIKRNISLENWEIIYSTSISLRLNSILSIVREFIMKNYEQVIISKEFCSLRECDLIEIIKSQDLVVSREDVVVESILSWVRDESRSESQNTVEYSTEEHQSGPTVAEKIVKEEDKMEHVMNPVNESVASIKNDCQIEMFTEDRKQCLYRLISNTRIILVNPETLKKLFNDSLVMDNKAAREMVMDAAVHKSKIYSHGQCLQASVHRKCDDLENVGIISNKKGQFIAIRFNFKFLGIKFPDCPFLTNCSRIFLFSYVTDFFAIGDFIYDSKLCVFVQNNWREFMKLQGIGWLGVAVDEFIYLFNNSFPYNQVQRLNPKLGNRSLKEFIAFPTRDKIEHVCSDDYFILLFCSYDTKTVEQTCVHCLNTRSKVWTRLGNLEGSAKNIVSFKKEKQLYILQANGNLWECSHDEPKELHLKLVGAIWHQNYELYGAACFNDILYLYGNKSIDESLLPLPLFSKIITNGSLISTWSNIVPAVVLKKPIFNAF